MNLKSNPNYPIEQFGFIRIVNCPTREDCYALTLNGSISDNLLDGISTILLAETESPVILHPPLLWWFMYSRKVSRSSFTDENGTIVCCADKERKWGEGRNLERRNNPCRREQLPWNQTILVAPPASLTLVHTCDVSTFSLQFKLSERRETNVRFIRDGRKNRERWWWRWVAMALLTTINGGGGAEIWLWRCLGIEEGGEWHQWHNSVSGDGRTLVLADVDAYFGDSLGGKMMLRRKEVELRGLVDQSTHLKLKTFRLCLIHENTCA
ncbi:hypothetical protein LXL04_014297 [Taraxacum kok-saghyz]